MFVVSVGNELDENLLLVGDGNDKNILTFEQWRGIDSSDIGPLADLICNVRLNIL